MDKSLVEYFSLAGRSAVVVGAASGIGREAAITFAKAGARVVIADIDRAGLDDTEAMVRAWSREVEQCSVDVRDRDAMQALADGAAAKAPIDVWVNAAGVISTSLVAETAPAELDRIVSINQVGTYWGCAAAARIMGAQGRGSIINLSSGGADWPGPGLSVYAMTKAAVNMLTRALAHELGPLGVRVNAVAPGFIDTPMVAYRFRGPDGRIDEKLREDFFAMRADQTVLKRTGKPIDIALALLYLASDASSFMTGQIVRPNGGMAMP